jgi:putative membrane protein
MNRSLGIALFAATAMISAPALAKPAAEFLKQAGQGDQSEVTLGNYAAQHGASAGIRDYGRRLARDHGAHLGKVQALARSKHVAVPRGMAPDAERAFARLQHVRGAAFDREFASHMVADHKMDIADYEAQARGGDRDTAALARSTLPTLREHLRIAQSLNH